MRLFRVRDKELRFIGVGSRVRHSENASVIELRDVLDESRGDSRRGRQPAKLLVRFTLSVERTSSANGLPHTL